MSQINCADLAKTREFGQALRAVGVWIDAHRSPTVNLIDPQQISRELPQFSNDEIANAIFCLAADGGLTPVFAVRTPTGVLADKVYAAPDAVPDIEEDRFRQPFATAGSEVVPLFKIVNRR
jgi:hypothetical protein